MANFETANIIENEIIKAEDVNKGYDAIINNISIALKTALAQSSKNYVIGGAVKVKDGLKVTIDPILLYHKEKDVLAVESEKVEIDLPAEADGERRDVIRVKAVANELFNTQTRRMLDPTTGNTFNDTVQTQKRTTVLFDCLKGVSGAACAESADPDSDGYVKLAEVRINAGQTRLADSDIFNITANFEGDVNTDWTRDKDSVFNPGYLTTDKLQEIIESVDTKVNKTSTANKVYGTDQNGAQTLYSKDSFTPSDFIKSAVLQDNGNSLRITKQDNSNITYKPVISNKAATLAWGASTTLATVAGTDITAKMPAAPTSLSAVSLSTDGTALTFTKTDGTSVKFEPLKNIYKVGDIFLSVSNTNPAGKFGGTWQMVGAGYALWTATSGAGGTIKAGLPNITGSVTELQFRDRVNNESGALKIEYVDDGGKQRLSDPSNISREKISFDASKSNSIYGASNTVQPSAYKIYAWRKTA